MLNADRYSLLNGHPSLVYYWNRLVELILMEPILLVKVYCHREPPAGVRVKVRVRVRAIILFNLILLTPFFYSDNYLIR